MKIGIMGASGYAGGELLRLLLPHPEAEVEFATSSRFAGEFIYMVHPNLRGSTKLKFTPPSVRGMAEACDLVFLATPHGVSKDMVGDFLEAGVRVVDLSADFRLKNPADYPKWYGWEHPHPEMLADAIFGLIRGLDGDESERWERTEGKAFYVLRNTSMPSVLVETEFATNEAEARRLANPFYLARLATEIANGVVEWAGARMLT